MEMGKELPAVLTSWKGKSYQRIKHKPMSNLAAAAAALKNKPQPTASQNNSSNIPSNPQPISRWDKQRKLMLTLQEAIKAERKAQGLTQRQLARKSGMSQGTITRAECHGWVSIST